MLEGRTPDQKRAFSKQVTDVAVATLGVNAKQVRVIIIEVSAEHWSIGGVSKADIDSGKTNQQQSE
jgi:4-oxalocrotonate tautomerase